MKTLLGEWHSDKLKMTMVASWLLTVFFCFFGSTVFLVKIPGFVALYPFRVLLPFTTVLYLVWTIREKRNPWKAASPIQRIGYVLCGIMLVYSTLSLFWAVDFEFSFTLWITFCFDLVFFALTLELCRDRQIMDVTVWCAFAATVVHIAMGIIEVFMGGFFTERYYEVFFFFGRHLTSPSVSSGNPNDYCMMVIFMLALMLLFWAWRGRGEKYNWLPVVLIAPVYFLLGASYARLCTVAFWIIVVAFVMYAMTSGKLVRQALIPAVLLLAATMAFLAYGENYHRLSQPVQNESVIAEVNMDIPEIAVPAGDQPQVIVLSQFVPEENSAAAEVESEPVMISSENIRLDLLIHTWHCFIESKGMGVGIGNTAQLAKPTAAKRDNIWAIHCFIARMAADFGIWFLIPFAIIAVKLLQFGVGYVLQEKKKGDWQSVMTGVLYLTAVLIYPIASTAAGDAQNCVPMWLFLGVIMLFPTMIQESD